MGKIKGRTEIAELGEFGLIDTLTEPFKATGKTTIKGVGDDAAVIEDLGADSLDIVEMLMTLEDEMNIIIPDDATGLKTVKDIATFIENEIA